MFEECDKHPINFMNINPKEFYKNFKNLDNTYKRDLFEELSKEYKIHMLEDISKGRTKLAKSLGYLSNSCNIVSQTIVQDFKENKSHFFGFYAEDFSRSFGFTNYFYQRECFKLARKDMPQSFDSVLGAMDLVCNACKKYMNNPFE